MSTVPGNASRRSLLRLLPLLGTMVGLALAAWLVATNDVSAVASAFGRVGPLGLVGVVLVRAVIVVLCGLAWARVLSGLVPLPSSPFLTLRFVREGINVLLPVASVGGDLVGGRLLTFWGVSGALAAASILVDMLIQVCTQFLFTLGGVILLLQVKGDAAVDLAHWALQVLAVAAALIAAFFVVQRLGTARFIEHQVARLSRAFQRESDAPEPRGHVQDALDAVWATRRRSLIVQGFALHLVAWALGALEIWIAAACLGLELGLVEVLILESLEQAIKSAAFPVPSGLGVQETGFVVVGALFGIDPGTAIALSLVKRVPDVVLGLPSLMAWQVLEARRAPILDHARR